MTIRTALLPLFAACLLLVGTHSLAATPAAFTARYNVSQGGEPMGEATISLQHDGDGAWVYRKSLTGTGGLAAILGVRSNETSRFRWKGDVPEAISYEYRLVAAGKNKQRHLSVDWATHQVTIDDGKGPQTYAASPGLVERNTLALAVGMALRDGQQQITLPVAVRQGVELQKFAVRGHDPIKVGAGSFDAVRVERSDAAREFSAWYAPAHYPVPVKLAQHDGGDVVMELVSYQAL